MSSSGKNLNFESPAFYAPAGELIGKNLNIESPAFYASAGLELIGKNLNFDVDLPLKQFRGGQAECLMGRAAGARAAAEYPIALIAILNGRVLSQILACAVHTTTASRAQKNEEASLKVLNLQHAGWPEQLHREQCTMFPNDVFAMREIQTCREQHLWHANSHAGILERFAS